MSIFDPVKQKDRSEGLLLANPYEFILAGVTSAREPEKLSEPSDDAIKELEKLIQKIN